MSPDAKNKSMVRYAQASIEPAVPVLGAVPAVGTKNGRQNTKDKPW